MNNIEKLKLVATVNMYYRDYLYDYMDNRPINLHLESLGLKPIGELKIKLKDELEGVYKIRCYEGKTGTISDFDLFGNEPIFSLNELDGEFGFDQIEEII